MILTTVACLSYEALFRATQEICKEKLGLDLEPHATAGDRHAGLQAAFKVGCCPHPFQQVSARVKILGFRKN